jgi:hypothetical protein
MADFDNGRVWAAWATPGYKMEPAGIEKLRKLCNKWRTEGAYATDRIGGWPGGFEHIDLATAKDESIGMARLVDEKYRLAFETAQAIANELSQAAMRSDEPQVDPYLHMAGLQSRACGTILQIATGEVIFPPKGITEAQTLWEKYQIDYMAIHYALARTYLYWPPEKVAECVAKANWENAKARLIAAKGPIAAFYSAQQFLEACSKMKLGIRFAAQ